MDERCLSTGKEVATNSNISLNLLTCELLGKYKAVYSVLQYIQSFFCLTSVDIFQVIATVLDHV